MTTLITDTTLRDAHQSLIATRMRTRDMLGILGELDKVGFYSLEVWGGATFDSCIRFLNEDPWERLRTIRKAVKNTRLQMLLRGQNLVGYRHYADDVVREFVRLSVKNGIDVFRVFDALNDIRNMRASVSAVKEFGGTVQGVICYTTSPVHTLERFAEMAQELENIGSDAVCIKDMAGLISPQAATDLVTAIKQRVKIPVVLHSHCSSGMAPISYFTAARAGANILDTAFSAFGWGSSQPPTESVVAALQGTPYDTGLDLAKLNEINDYFLSLSNKYRMLFTAEATRPNASVLLHQIPGGMISNLVSQLREQNALDRLHDVYAEIPRVRADLGYPPLVTPTSQVVGTQAVLNVLSGERYKQVTRETKNYLMGLYGAAVGEVNEQVRRAVIGDEKAVTVRPADLLPAEMNKVKEETHKLGIAKSDEDVMTYALYPEIAVKFLRGEMKEETLVPSQVASATPAAAQSASVPTEFSVDVDGDVFNVKVSPISSGVTDVSPVRQKASADQKGAVLAPMNGMILTVRANVGDKVAQGDVVATIEAMKMASEICAQHGGVVKEVFVHDGELVSAKDVIMIVESDDK
ncbi:MAG: sodium-extruding oxaloacetate decarboxylase subunit alpha [Dehalococcoidia bacterium]|nr:sodium-extruding oxaloacetate decarboxylase subunit alpha [Dehalococcoidia bacterium]